MNNLKVKQAEDKGRGVFADKDLDKGEVIEKCPVIELNAEDRENIDNTELYNYYFSWGENNDKAAVALGFGSIYNHSFEPNADYEKDFQDSFILFKAIKDIEKGEEILVDYTQGGEESNLWFNLG